MLPFGRMTWVLFGLFVVVGAVALAADDPAWRRNLGGVCGLLVGGLGLSIVRHAIGTGQIPVRSAVVRHADRPRLFWICVAIVAGAGITVVVATLWVVWLRGNA